MRCYEDNMVFNILIMITIFITYWQNIKGKMMGGRRIWLSDYEKYEEENPLFSRGMFRKINEMRDVSFFSHLKLRFYCQLQAIGQIICLILMSVFPNNRIVKYICPFIYIWCILLLIAYFIIIVYYEYLFEKPYKWYPFCNLGLNKIPAHTISCEFKSFVSLNDFLIKLLKEQGYHLGKSVKWHDEDLANIYVRENLNSIEIFEVISVKELNKDHISYLNESFMNYIEMNQNLKKQKKKAFYSTFLLCVDIPSQEFKNIMNIEVWQSKNKYRFLVGIIFQERKLYIPQPCAGRQSYKKEYNKLLKKFLDIYRGE